MINNYNYIYIYHYNYNFTTTTLCFGIEPNFLDTGRGRDRSLQRRFPFVDILFRSGDIRDRSSKSSKIH